MSSKIGAPLDFSNSENIVAITRKKLQISQDEFARMIGLTRGAISQFENGKREISGPVKLLCKILQKNPNIISTL